MMMAITLWQPWATLIAQGYKTYETRSWSTNYRGPLAIHAAKRLPKKGEFSGQIDILAALREIGIKTVGDLPFGCVICTVDLVDVIPTGSIPIAHQKFGDFSDGRYAWQLENVAPLLRPLPVTGRQGLWHVSLVGLTNEITQ